MGLEGLIVLLVVALIVLGWYGNGRWYNNPAGGPAPGPGGIIGLLLTILVAIIIIVLIFAVLGGAIHIR